jgi:hypothetical protein
MKIKIFLGFLILVAIFSCKREANAPTPALKKLIKQCFVGDRFKWRMGIKSNNGDHFYIFSDDAIKESVVIQGNFYEINSSSVEIDSSKVFTLKLDSVDATERILEVEHIYFPSMTTKIESAFKFKYLKNAWILKDSALTIADGHYLFPKLR